MPELGQTYWQDLKKSESEENSVADIVKKNCQTIFNPDDITRSIKPSIFDN